MTMTTARPSETPTEIDGAATGTVTTTSVTAATDLDALHETWQTLRRAHEAMAGPWRSLGHRYVAALLAGDAAAMMGLVAERDRLLQQITAAQVRTLQAEIALWTRHVDILSDRLAPVQQEWRAAQVAYQASASPEARSSGAVIAAAKERVAEAERRQHSLRAAQSQYAARAQGAQRHRDRIVAEARQRFVGPALEFGT